MPEFDELVRKAFPDHPYNEGTLHSYLLAKKFNKPVSPDLETHVASCEYCKEQIRRMENTDSLLNGEWEKREKVLVTVSSSKTPR